MLQNSGNVHWYGIRFGHLRVQYPEVADEYSRKDPAFPEAFKRTWNHFGQFPKYRIRVDVPPTDDQLAGAENISSDEEDEHNQEDAFLRTK